MGNTKSIPVVGETVTAVESGFKITVAGVVYMVGEDEEADKLVKGAGDAWVEYSEKNMIVGPINSCVRLAKGDKAGAKRVIKSTGRALESVADNMPGVGHVKGAVHYAVGDTEHGHQCMLGATRSTAVVGAGLATGGLGAGFVAGGLAGAGSGIAFDGAHSAIESAVKEERRTHGIWNLDRDAKACKNANDLADFELGCFGSILGDFMAGSAAAEAGKALREAHKVKSQQNKVKNAYKKAAKKSNIDPDLACKDTIEAARNLDKHVKDGTFKGEGQTVTKVRNMETGEVNDGYNAHAEGDMNVKKFETEGKSSGFNSKRSAKKAASAKARGKSALMEQNPEVNQVVPKRQPQACAEHQAFDGFYKTAAPGTGSTLAQVVSVQLKNGIYQAVVRCANCLEYAKVMGKVATDLIAGQRIPVARISPYISSACRCGAVGAGAAACSMQRRQG